MIGGVEKWNQAQNMQPGDGVQHIGRQGVQEPGVQPVIGMGSAGFGAERPVARNTPVLHPQHARGVQQGLGAVEVSQAGPVAQVAPTDQYHAPQRLENGNPVAEFVLERVSSTEDLHAETLEEGNTRFTQVTAGILAGMEVDDNVSNDGTQFRVDHLGGAPGVVVKRMKVTSDELPLQGSPPARQFQALRDEHDLFTTYFGTRHVPYTATVIVNGTNFGDQNADVKPGREYVMLQEEYDTDALPYGRNLSVGLYRELEAVGKNASDALRAEGDSFAAAYHAMQVEALAIPESGIVIDDSGNHIFAADTNTPITFRKMVDGSQLLASHGIDPATITHPSELYTALTTIVPELRKYHGKPWEKVRDTLDPTSPEVHNVYTDMLFMQSKPADAEEMRHLLGVLDDFPPDGSENGTIRQLRTLGIATPQNNP